MNNYSLEEIMVFKEILIKKKNIENEQIENIDQILREISENGKDENNVDTTSYSVQIENLMNSRYRMLKHLSHINNALLRIENNCYGKCAETGKLIAKERLLAVPTTTLSMEGKLIREKNF